MEFFVIWNTAPDNANWKEYLISGRNWSIICRSLILMTYSGLDEGTQKLLARISKVLIYLDIFNWKEAVGMLGPQRSNGENS